MLTVRTEKEQERQTRIEALSEYLDVDASKITDGYLENTFKCVNRFDPDGLYLVLYAYEAEEMTAHIIKQKLWAFNPDYLQTRTGFAKVVFERLGELCERANEAVFELIEASCGYKDFVEDVIITDGMGKFLAEFDRIEEEVQGLYVFRVG